MKYDVIIFDGDNTAHKGYHRNKELNVTKDGETIHTGMCYGFLNMMLGVYKKYGYKGTRIMVAWDVRNSAESNKEILSTYKSNRQATTQEQLEEKALFDTYKETVKQVLASLNILQFYKDGTEADDIIATLNSKISKWNKNILIVTEDKDYRQLISKNTHLYGISQRLLWDIKTFREKTGLLKPTHFVDYLAICGDAIDGFNGVKGFGNVKALKILNCHELQQFDSISEAILSDPYKMLSLTELSENDINRFITDIDNFRISYQLAKLDTNIKTVSLYSEKPHQIEVFKAFMLYFDMKSMLKDENMYEFVQINIYASTYLNNRINIPFK